MIELEKIIEAYARIAPHLVRTPIFSSEFLNQQLGHNIFFKVESLQKTGAFKIRGVLNKLLSLDLKKIHKIICYSTGNHGLALAWAGNKLSVETEIYMPKYTSVLKQNMVKDYGAELILTETREQAEELARLSGSKANCLFLSPSDDDEVIAGAGTLFYEAIQQLEIVPDAVFASIGGGGLISGTFSVAKQLAKRCAVIGGEPEEANDAYLSKQSGQIFRFTDSPKTIADGLRTLGLSARTFEYIQKLDDLILSTEDEIIYWTAWLGHLLKVSVEPSCAVGRSAAYQLLKEKKQFMKVVVLVSGGNLDQEMMKAVWNKDHLTILPKFLR